MDTHMVTTERGLLNQQLSQRLTQKLIPICYMVDTMDILMPMDIMATHMLIMARGLLRLSQNQKQRLTQKLIPTYYMVDMDTMDTLMLTMERGLLRLNQLLRLIQRLIPTCYTVDTMDILILMDIMVIHMPHILESKLKSLMPMFSR